MTAPDVAGTPDELPPLTEPGASDPAPVFRAIVNGQPTAAYIAHLYLRKDADPGLADEGLRCWFGGGGAWILRRFTELCKRLGWSGDARRVDWLVCEYAETLGKDLLVAWNLPFCELLEWAEEYHRPAPPPAPTLNVSLTVAPVVNIPPSPPPPTAAPTSLAEIADALAKGKPRSHIPQRLLRHMDARDLATFSEIAEHVHGDLDTTPAAINQAVLRANRALEKYASSTRLSVSDERVLKKIDPA